MEENNKKIVRQVTPANKNGSLRVTIPAKISESLDLKAGDSVIFEIGEKITLTKMEF